MGITLGLFTEAETVDITRFCGYPAYAAFNYTLAAGYGEFTTQVGSLDAAQVAVIRSTFLTPLYIMETAIDGAGANLDTDAASVWTHNKDEVADRTGLFNQKRRGLCGFVGCDPGPALSGRNRVIRT